MTVMAGVSVVGFSGSMIKDAVKEDGFAGLVRVGAQLLGDQPPQPIEEPEITKVLVGPYPTIRSYNPAIPAFADVPHAAQVSSSSSSRRCCT